MSETSKTNCRKNEKGGDLYGKQKQTKNSGFESTYTNLGAAMFETKKSNDEKRGHSENRTRDLSHPKRESYH